VIASVQSEADNNKIKDLANQQQCGSTWLGLERNDRKSTQEFADNWADGSRKNFTKWQGGEPNGMQEKCVQM